MTSRRFVRRFGMLFLFAAVPLTTAAARVEEPPDSQAREVIARAIEAMGGDAYMNVERTASHGRYFQFSKGRRAFSRYWDWTVYEPAKWRFQLGEGRREFIRVYNLELGKGWTLSGRTTVEEASEDEIRDFRRVVKQDLGILLRHRLDEEGMNLYYYGPDDVAGAGHFEAVEFLDATNDAVVVFFDRRTHLPAKLETHHIDSLGIRRKRELEFSNWHVIQGVRMPLRYDIFTDQEMSSQRFLEEITINPSIPPDFFLEPVPDKK